MKRWAPGRAAPARSTVHEQPYQRAGNHPYVSFRAGPDMYGQHWIHFHCSRCADSTKKPCMDPRRTNSHVMRYAMLHGHGLRPHR